MASNYSKLDLKSFKTRLGEDAYKNATGARRGVGKSEMTADEKEKAYKAINAHFGVESKPVPAPKAKRVAKAVPAKSAATKTTRTAGRAKKTAAKKTAGRGRKASDSEAAPALDQHNELANLQAAADATRSAMAGLTEAAHLDATLDVKASAQQGADILKNAIARIHEIVGELPSSSPATLSEPPAADVPSDEEEDDSEEGEDEEEAAE